MKFNKLFHIKLQPHYVIKEPTNYHEIELENENSKELGGINTIDGDTEEYESILRSGGRMDWSLYNEPDSHKPEINVNLMRIWAVQLVTQMINEKAYVNEIISEPKFNVSEDDKDVFLEIIENMTKVLHDELENVNDSMILKKKNKFKFTEDEK
jgi:hypothetical protein